MTVYEPFILGLRDILYYAPSVLLRGPSTKYGHIGIFADYDTGHLA